MLSRWWISTISICGNISTASSGPIHLLPHPHGLDGSTDDAVLVLGRTVETDENLS
jgi:hypothetical protein